MDRAPISSCEYECAPGSVCQAVAGFDILSLPGLSLQAQPTSSKPLASNITRQYLRVCIQMCAGGGYWFREQELSGPNWESFPKRTRNNAYLPSAARRCCWRNADLMQNAETNRGLIRWIRRGA